MSKVFSIITTINLDKLDSEINEYISQNGNFDPYIFMNEDTANAIRQEIGADILDKDVNLNAKPLKDGIRATYCGYKVFINNDLKLGIVEIR